VAVNYHFCADCNTEYYKKGTININFILNGKSVYFQIRANAEDNPAARLMDDESAEAILEFQTIPNVTPSNIVEKMKLYLLFS
jgi:hypothetical protein